MKIISLTAENFKRLVAVHIDPKGNMVELTGKNAQGKTSVLDAIMAALKVTNLEQAKPVREGEERALVRLDLGDLVVTRKFKFDKETGETTTSVAVTAADGAKYQSPQSMLDGLLSSLTFDPLAFSRLDAAGQVKSVRSLLPGVDFDSVAAANKVDFDARTEVNRKAKDLDAELRGMPAKPAEVPKSVDKTALMAQLTQASSHNTTLETKKNNRANAKAKMEENDARILVIDAEIKKLQEEAEELKTWNAEKTAAIAAAGALPDPIDTADVARQIEAADATNKLVEQENLRLRKESELLALYEKAQGLTTAMETRKLELAAQVAKAKLPVQGLSFSDEGILLNGIPFNQASDAEQLRTSIAIAMSLNPKLRVIRVRDGSLLDEDGMALLEKMATENDYQVWIERVDSSGQVGFVLEDGHLKGQEAAPAAAAPVKTPKTSKPKSEASLVAEALPTPPAAPAPKPSDDELL